MNAPDQKTPPAPVDPKRRFVDDLRGQLLARKANLEQHGQQVTARSLMLEKQLDTLRGEISATQGAAQEIDRTLAILDGKEVAP